MFNPLKSARIEPVGFGPQTKLPTPDEVRSWWDTYGMLDNIRAHSEVVTKVALLLCNWLTDAEVELNCLAVETGALAHDIAKTQCLGTERMHSIEGQEIVEALGYPELGQLVGLHVVLPRGYPLDESMLVNYADKRVKHDQVVDLDERFSYIAQRYGRGDPDILERIKKGRQRAQEVEDAVFARLEGSHDPQEVQHLWEQGKL